MQERVLDKVIKFDDIEFINGCGINYRLDDPALIGPTDSGWCEYGTGYRIPTETTRVVFCVNEEAELVLLKLKFNNSLILF